MKPRKSYDSSARCSACSSSKNKNPDRTFHRFPTNIERCNLWIQKCNLQHLEERTAQHLNKNYRLCSEHFDGALFSGKRLVANALPTKNLTRQKIKNNSGVRKVADSNAEAVARKIITALGINGKLHLKLPGSTDSVVTQSDQSNISNSSETVVPLDLQEEIPQKTYSRMRKMGDTNVETVPRRNIPVLGINGNAGLSGSTDSVVTQNQSNISNPETVVPPAPPEEILRIKGNAGPRLPGKTNTVVTQKLNDISNSLETVVPPVPQEEIPLKTYSRGGKMADTNVGTLPRKNIPVLENIQNRNNVLTVTGVNAKMSLKDFHSDTPTILNVFSYPQENWLDDLGPVKPVQRAKVDAGQKRGCCLERCKKCRDKFGKMLRRKQVLQQENQKLRDENSRLSKFDPKRLNETQRRLVEGMFKSRKLKARGYRYDHNLLNDSVKLRQISRPAYLFVKKYFHLPIPSEISLHRYITKMNEMVGGVTDDDLVSGDAGQVVQEVNFDEVDDTLFGNEVPTVQEFSFSEADDTFVVASDVETVEIVSSRSAVHDQTCNVPEPMEVETVEVVSSHSADDGQTQIDFPTCIVPEAMEVEMGEVMVSQLPLEVNVHQTCNDVPTEFVSSNCGGDERLPLEVGVDQTSSNPASVVFSNCDSYAQVPIDADQTRRVLAPVQAVTAEVVSSNPVGNGRVPHNVDNDQTSSVLAPVFPSDSGSDGQVPLEVSVDQISNVQTAEVVSSNSVLLQVVNADQTCRLIAPLGVVTNNSGEQFFVIPTYTSN